MRKQLFALVAASLISVAAQATPVLSVNGSTTPAILGPNSQNGLALFLLIPMNEPLAGYNLIFEISDTASNNVISCTLLGPNAIASCADPTGLNFSFGANFGSDQTGSLVIGVVTINTTANAMNGATITLTGASTWTDPAFNDFFFAPQVVARVVAAPEPALASLLAAGLGGLALLGSKRSA
jgi:hypothetical protein